jgi:hypothetical protein
MRPKGSIPGWLYITVGLLALVPIVVLVLVGKYMVPKMYSAAKATAVLGKDDTLQYRGQTIQLSKAYADFDEYKNDPLNIAGSETARVQQLVATAPIADRFATREALVSAIMEIEFPGYGLSAFGEVPQSDGTTLTGFAVEIPRADQERIIVFQLKNGSYRLLDDLLGPADVMELRLAGGRLEYLNGRQQVVLTRPLSLK